MRGDAPRLVLRAAARERRRETCSGHAINDVVTFIARERRPRDMYYR